MGQVHHRPLAAATHALAARTALRRRGIDLGPGVCRGSVLAPRLGGDKGGVGTAEAGSIAGDAVAGDGCGVDGDSSGEAGNFCEILFLILNMI